MQNAFRVSSYSRLRQSLSELLSQSPRSPLPTTSQWAPTNIFPPLGFPSASHGPATGASVLLRCGTATEASATHSIPEPSGEESAECVVVGAGVVGLAVARELSLAGREVVLLEAAPAIGTGISSRSSEVIHAGIYYPPGSLKARLCVAGRRLLYSFCADAAVPFRKTGKLIVATDPQQLDALSRLHDTATLNGVEGLRLLSPAEAAALEPQLQCVAALWSPETGIVDSHALMLAMQTQAERAGATVALSSALLSGTAPSASDPRPSFLLSVGEVGPQQQAASPAPTTPPHTSVPPPSDAISSTLLLRTSTLVNAAGLDSIPLAHRLSGLPPSSIPPLYLAKGNYFSLATSSPFSHLVYPLPDPAGGLGIHATVDLAGRLRFGPDVQWLPDPSVGGAAGGPAFCAVQSQLDFRVDAARAAAFYSSVRRYLPSLPDGALFPDYAGVRPKLARPPQPAADFVIQGRREHGVPGLVNLFGIESPGLTASLAIAREVRALLEAE